MGSVSERRQSQKVLPLAERMGRAWAQRVQRPTRASLAPAGGRGGRSTNVSRQRPRAQGSSENREGKAEALEQSSNEGFHDGSRVRACKTHTYTDLTRAVKKPTFSRVNALAATQKQETRGAKPRQDDV